MGHTVTIMAPNVNRSIKSEKGVWRFRSMVYPGQPEHRICFPWSRQLARFEDLKIDVIHAQTPFPMGYLALHLSRKYQIPAVHTYHTYFEKYAHYVPLVPKAVTTWFARWESRRFCNQFETIVVPSVHMQDKLTHYGLKVPTVVVPTGMSRRSMTYMDEPAVVRRKYNIPAASRLLMYAGRLGGEKNIMFLLDSVDRVRQQVPDLRLLIVGDGPDHQKLAARVRELGMTDQVIFAGYLAQPSVFSAMRAADVFTFPSMSETQGLTVLESIAMGTPVVGIDAMGVAEIIEGNQGGFLTQPDVADYSARILELLQNPGLRQKKSREALERAKQFTAPELAHRMLRVFEEARHRYTSRLVAENAV